MDIEIVNIEGQSITDAWCESNGWYRSDEKDGDSTFHFWSLPLPRDNPDANGPYLISSASDETEFLGILPGQFFVEIFNLGGLGNCKTVEDIEHLYRVLVKQGLYDKLSGGTDDMSEND